MKFGKLKHKLAIRQNKSTKPSFERVRHINSVSIVMENYFWGPYLLVVNMNVLDTIKLFHMIPVVRDFETSNALSSYSDTPE